MVWPMFYKGVYHLFYQYNPKGAVWGNIVWEHAVSKDLINWESLETAIVPSEWYDIKGCWSGSATILTGEKPVILYTGWDNSSRQVQNMAVPKNASDPYLREWIKIPQNPIMVPLPENGINVSSFRDPTTAWLGKDGRWRLIVGNKEDRHHKGRALLYTSKDFIRWTKKQHPLHSSKKTGMWECPDFYPVSHRGELGLDTSVTGPGLKHVLKVSLDDTRFEYYTIGTYFPDLDRYVPDNTSVDNKNGLRYDYGKFYASKTFFDNYKTRRILWGWINESDSTQDDVDKGWSGVQAMPRSIWLDNVAKSQLIQWPVSELESLRGNKIYKEDIILMGGSTIEISGLTAAQADVEVSFNLPSLTDVERMDSNLDAQQLCSVNGTASNSMVGPFGLLVLASSDLAEQTAVYFRIGHHQNKMKVLMCSDQSRSSLQSDVDKTTYGAFVPFSLKQKSLSLRILVDHSIVESFGEGGKSCITARAYPTQAIGEDARLYLFNNGSTSVVASKLTAWDMGSAQQP
ncbi:beta-fructofuranosidase, insoluble isoenzyme 1 isoform X1 [Cryptomeria japonica]|uniref:beta-fructofuranosidase, insoluble isoenzyme 1 isoform X1 n=2 Tax=Cryptomeria japonica TaxID=3369 RepID=UPI0027DA1587|nr:beta-fructofuranosidase, insoluble isoenzyme 1 isoform X1 [Cryptomeria japonica]